MAGLDPHSRFEVRLCAHGALPDDARRELADFAEVPNEESVVLRGAVADQAALLGVLDLLRRAGLHLRDVEAVTSIPDTGSSPVVARLVLKGEVADLLHLVVTEPHTITASATTTLEIALPDDAEALFRLLDQLERLALDVHEVHVRPQPG